MLLCCSRYVQYCHWVFVCLFVVSCDTGNPQAFSQQSNEETTLKVHFAVPHRLHLILIVTELQTGCFQLLADLLQFSLSTFQTPVKLLLAFASICFDGVHLTCLTFSLSPATLPERQRRGQSLGRSSPL